MRAGNCYKGGGQLLKIGEITNFDPEAATHNGDMSKTKLYTEWIELNQETSNGSFEFLWKGTNAQGKFVIEASDAGPP